MTDKEVKELAFNLFYEYVHGKYMEEFERLGETDKDRVRTAYAGILNSSKAYYVPMGYSK